MKQVQRRRVRAGVAQVDIRKYPNRLQLYRDPPLEEVTLEEFETFGFDRLKGISIEFWLLFTLLSAGANTDKPLLLALS
jgi:hypothetical protein